jgi:prepilin peptidase CpaA
MSVYALSSTAPLSSVLLGVLALAVWFDVRERRIPNGITVAGTLAALGLRAALGGGALESGLLGLSLGLFLGLLFFAAGAMGAGDGKLLATVGALLGIQALVWCLPLIGGFGGLLVLATSARQRTLRPTFVRFRDLLFHVASLGRIGERRTLASPGAVAVPYGVAVAAGAAMAWLGWGITP